MTLEDFNNIVDSYGLHKIRHDSVSGFFEKYTWGDSPVVTYFEDTGKLKIYVDLDKLTGKISYSERHLIVSEVSTANYYLKRLFKQRKKILVNNKLKEINSDFT